MTRELIQTTAFRRAIRKYLKRNPQCAQSIEQTLDALAADAFAPKLRTHKLQGDLDGVWACSAGYDLRILFDFVEDDNGPAILLLTIGTHDSVY